MDSGASSNWKNVNNWHWVDKNCLSWAREYMNKLVGMDTTVDGRNVKVESVTSVDGDCDLNQRKGKVIGIYDVEIKLRWTAGSDESAKGTIHIPELMHDTSADELVFVVSADKDDASAHAFKEVVRKHLTKKIASALASFSKDLMDAHAKDVFIPAHEMTGHPVLTSYQPKPPISGSSTAQAPAPAASTSVAGALVTITQKITFMASPQDIYLALLDKPRVSAWTRADATISKDTGSEFSLFGGNVSGKMVELVENKSLEMTWRLRTWPKDHYSNVKMALTESNGETVLRLTQSGVPIGERDITETNWKNYYWNPIKATFGFGMML